jgi:hypothetical protein
MLHSSPRTEWPGSVYLWRKAWLAFLVRLNLLKADSAASPSYVLRGRSISRFGGVSRGGAGLLRNPNKGWRLGWSSVGACWSGEELQPLGLKPVHFFDS